MSSTWSGCSCDTWKIILETSTNMLLILLEIACISFTDNTRSSNCLRSIKAANRCRIFVTFHVMTWVSEHSFILLICIGGSDTKSALTWTSLPCDPRGRGRRRSWWTARRPSRGRRTGRRWSWSRTSRQLWELGERLGIELPTKTSNVSLDTLTESGAKSELPQVSVLND